ncbi:LOW QUALITY PROTEIN: semaphorin-7A [Xyrichtys novacula]|uniref:LOW QUALITY PROTEIN: semaphorin-7A n=1 Tax=Xyrichtys novacula TaxID=13765 RepID=A0AAV1F748_XYRNO|nr:LOW QUALITY PROTEIN: semaphorin-7A [Xyrichtys novacula]
MRRFVLKYFVFALDFYLVLTVGLKDIPILGSGKNNPRLLIKDILGGGFAYTVPQNHSVFFYQTDYEEMYVGGTDFVLKLDVNDYHIIEKYPLETTGQQQCQEGQCENVVTVIEKFQDSLFVCGTNGHKPQCWKLFSSVNNQSYDIVESYEGTGISPFAYTQNYLSLTVEGDLYSAAPLDTDGSSLQFRRKAGSRTNVWMYDSWVSEPTFISSSWVRRMEDPENEKIYIFFREKNSDPNPEAEPWISRVARVCKVDEGGSKRFFQNMWTSFLKARLVCGFREESLYFNRLQDIFVMHAEDWRNTRVYALFTSSWNATAVCIYTVGMIEEIFENSTFKGYNKDIPTPRPGTCVKNSKGLPLATVNMVKDYPEMADWVHSVHTAAPFYTSNYNYTKIAVDQVKGANGDMYNVLLLATDSGKIHKVLEAESQAFIISETQLSSHSSIRSMKLDSKRKKLVVGFSEEVATMDLQRCHQYNKSCHECVLAQDPYCAWTESGCTPTVPGGIQNIVDGKTSVCSSSGAQKQVRRTTRETAPASPADLRTDHAVPLGVPFYLSCPIDSYHAVYTWEHGGQKSPCLQMQSNCLHLIPSMEQDSYGTYKCVSEEKDYTKLVKNYQLMEQKIVETTTSNERSDILNKRNYASAFVPQIFCIILCQALSVMGMV